MNKGLEKETSAPQSQNRPIFLLHLGFSVSTLGDDDDLRR